jgi:hypothetical protein
MQDSILSTAMQDLESQFRIQCQQTTQGFSTVKRRLLLLIRPF